MAKRRTTGKRPSADAVWKGLSDEERQMYCAFILLIQALCNDWVFKRELPARLPKTLQELDPQSLYAVVAECLSLLIDVPFQERLARGRREAEKDKRLSAAKKRPSAAKKKSRTKKKPAPKRRTARASSS